MKGTILIYLAVAIALPAQTLTTLDSFNENNGFSQYSGLVQGSSGDFYGTTYEGGVYNKNCTSGCGTVYKISPQGKLTTLYNFCTRSSAAGCEDGLYPSAGIIQSTDGDFYGTTKYGGSYNYLNCKQGCGTVFRITPAGQLTTLYSFNSTDGAAPSVSLVQAPKGVFYGSTSAGGDNGYGTAPGGILTTLHNFCSETGCADGFQPTALVQDANGDFYGTTQLGGIDRAHNYCSSGEYPGCGTVFKMTPSGQLTTLQTFCAQTGCPDGQTPNGLVEAANGDLYGTTSNTVFKMTPSGALTTLFNFVSEPCCSYGSVPQAGLVAATDGNFYGTTQNGGSSTCVDACGTIFKITPGGVLTHLYSFCAQTGCLDGEAPAAMLLQGTDGDFYGTTLLGGTYNVGTIFRFSAGLGPFLKTHPASGAAGDTVDILGTDLTGATGVVFNGVAAVFDVVSSSEITTSVPDGASTGYVEVATPRGTLSSNAPFQVLP